MEKRLFKKKKNFNWATCLFLLHFPFISNMLILWYCLEPKIYQHLIRYSQKHTKLMWNLPEQKKVSSWTMHRCCRESHCKNILTKDKQQIAISHNSGRCCFAEWWAWTDGASNLEKEKEEESALHSQSKEGAPKHLKCKGNVSQHMLDVKYAKTTRWWMEH